MKAGTVKTCSDEHMESIFKHDFKVLSQKSSRFFKHGFKVLSQVSMVFMFVVGGFWKHFKYVISGTKYDAIGELVIKTRVGHVIQQDLLVRPAPDLYRAQRSEETCESWVDSKVSGNKR